MRFETYNPCPSLSRWVRHYWIVDGGDNVEVELQKIVPDGFPELILHFADPYHVNISGNWEEQKRCLLAGQIRKHFYLRNSGKSAMFGMKLQPAAIRQLFQIDMSDLKDKVVPIPTNHQFVWEALVNDSTTIAKPEYLIEFIEDHLKAMASKVGSISNEEKALNDMVHQHGMVQLSDLYKTYTTNERKMERYFKTNIGLTPKFYCRILRFAHIFKLVEAKEKKWPEIAYSAGFFDQAHFIKNFKEFTGEEPGKYGFLEENMANFFLKP